MASVISLLVLLSFCLISVSVHVTSRRTTSTKNSTFIQGWSLLNVARIRFVLENILPHMIKTLNISITVFDSSIVRLTIENLDSTFSCFYLPGTNLDNSEVGKFTFPRVFNTILVNWNDIVAWSTNLKPIHFLKYV